ncbi:MAG: peptide deformylase [Wolbachia endosymbiont of Tyrophagus putrescentiae]|nr:peptide deformylase [Wolbachia endosymbiont of Tyrophagus putrescentiae]
MPTLPIVIAPDERLITRASEVQEINDEIKKLVNDMFETVSDANGFGLAAVQLGVLKRVFVTCISPEYQEEYPGYQSIGTFCMINPEITELSDEQVVMTEGCLSIPEQHYEIKRPQYLTVKYWDIDGKEKTIKANGWLARCIQHELDHLNGILYIRHLSKLKYGLAIKKAKKIKERYS